MRKVIKLQSLELTNKKKEELESARIEAKRIIEKYILQILDKCENNSELQQKIYHKIRKDSFLPSQVLLNLIRSSFHLKQKPKDKRTIERITLDYNIPRASKLFTLPNGTLCFAITIKPRHRIVVPIEMNGSIERFRKHIKNGWILKQVSLTNDNQVLLNLEKKKDPKNYKNHLGIDVNSNNISLTILTPKGKILKQLYLGKNLYKKKAKILKRKSKLQSYADKGDPKAREKLRKLNHKVSNMTKNAVGEFSKEIHNIAEEYESMIVMERLTKFPTNKGKKANRKISLIPFMLLRQRVIVRSVDTGVPLGYVHPYHTSKWCPRCGSVNPPHDKKNYAIYRCSECGLECNSDRKASLTIALKKFVGRDQKWFQYPTKRVSVNALFWGNDDKYSKGTEIPIYLSDPKVVL